jgi:hypothetical protein
VELYNVEMGRAVGSNGVVVEPTLVQEYLGEVVLNSMAPTIVGSSSSRIAAAAAVEQEDFVMIWLL